jgi:hypothetical protein
MPQLKYAKSEFYYKGILYAVGDPFPMDALEDEDRNDIFFHRLMDTPEPVVEVEPNLQPAEEEKSVKKKKRSKS